MTVHTDPVLRDALTYGAAAAIEHNGELTLSREMVAALRDVLTDLKDAEQENAQLRQGQEKGGVIP